MIKSCKKCMEGAPYDCCCKIECGQHEFCRSCKYIPRHNCYHEASKPIGDVKNTVVDWSKTRPLEPVVDWSKPIGDAKNTVVDWSKTRPLPPVTDEKDLIPIERVLDDMYSDTSGVSSAARDYYRMNYATEEEKIEMDEEDRIANKLTAIAIIIPVVMIIAIVFCYLYF